MSIAYFKKLQSYPWIMTPPPQSIEACQDLMSKSGDKDNGLSAQCHDHPREQQIQEVASYELFNETTTTKESILNIKLLKRLVANSTHMQK